MEKPTYSIRELEEYLLQKQAGKVDEKMERAIQSDSFLQMVFVGLKKKMNTNNNSSTTNILEAKKQKIWQAMENRISTSDRYATESEAGNAAKNTPEENLLDALLNYFSIKNYNPHFLRIHILLGLNCSCVFALILIACWLNNTADATLLVRHLDGLVGYRP
ncbi:MAG: hypothetical protein AB8F74_13535 [Saprospiraceae bacterium]